MEIVRFSNRKIRCAPIRSAGKIRMQTIRIDTLENLERHLSPDGDYVMADNDNENEYALYNRPDGREGQQRCRVYSFINIISLSSSSMSVKI